MASNHISVTDSGQVISFLGFPSPKNKGNYQYDRLVVRFKRDKK